MEEVDPSDPTVVARDIDLAPERTEAEPPGDVGEAILEAALGRGVADPFIEQGLHGAHAAPPAGAHLGEHGPQGAQGEEPLPPRAIERAGDRAQESRAHRPVDLRAADSEITELGEAEEADLGRRARAQLVLVHPASQLTGCDSPAPCFLDQITRHLRRTI